MGRVSRPPSFPARRRRQDRNRGLIARLRPASCRDRSQRPGAAGHGPRHTAAVDGPRLHRRPRGRERQGGARFGGRRDVLIPARLDRRERASRPVRRQRKRPDKTSPKSASPSTSWPGPGRTSCSRCSTATTTAGSTSPTSSGCSITSDLDSISSPSSSTCTPRVAPLIAHLHEIHLSRRRGFGDGPEVLTMNVSNERSPTTRPRHQPGGRAGRTRRAGDQEVRGW